jgi:hypothetical protein
MLEVGNMKDGKWGHVFFVVLLLAPIRGKAAENVKMRG